MPWICGLLAAFAFALYANTISHGYALDDAVAITGNDFTRAGLGGIYDLLTSDSFRGYFGRESDHVTGGRYRPLSLVTFALECELFGVTPHPSHVLNALLYALCVVVSYRILARLLGEARPVGWRPTLALVAALLFAAHPLHTEAVANIKGRDEILALLLSLVALGLCLRAVDGRRAAPRVQGAFVFFGALLAKESAITFLAVVPFAILFFRPERRREAFPTLGVLSVPALLYLGIRQSIVQSVPGPDELLNDPFLEASLAERYATVFFTLAQYLKLLVWPHPLTYDYYPYHVPLLGWTDWRPWLGLGLYAGMLAVAWLGFANRHVVSFGVGFYLLTLSVTSNLFFPVGTFMSERFLFAPSLGACLVAGWVVLALSERWPSRRLRPVLAAGLTVGLLVPMVAKTLVRNRAWKDTGTLVLTDVETSSGSAQARTAAADELVRQSLAVNDPGARSELARRALEHLEVALTIHPRYERAWTVRAYVDRHLLGDLAGALRDYARLLDLNPRAPDAAYNLGTLLLQHRPGRLDEAVDLLERAVEQNPRDPSAWRNLGAAYYRRGDTADAIAALERLARLRPDDASLLLDLAELYEEAGDVDESAHYRARAERLGGVDAPE